MPRYLCPLALIRKHPRREKRSHGMTIKLHIGAEEVPYPTGDKTTAGRPASSTTHA